MTHPKSDKIQACTPKKYKQMNGTQQNHCYNNITKYIERFVCFKSNWIELARVPTVLILLQLLTSI